MSFHPLRFALYSALFFFSAILIGLTAARIHRTHRLRAVDPLHWNLRRGFYEPAIAELLATSVIALIWSMFGLCLIASAFGKAAGSYLTEIICLSAIWVLYLVGAAIATSYWHNLGWCRPWSFGCRLMSSILAISWITWAITTFLLAASIASMVRGGHRFTHPLRGKEEGRTDAGGKGVRATPTGQGATAAPETRAVDAGAPATTGGGTHQQPV